jgi:two-component system, sensor histidine kinase ChiS
MLSTIDQASKRILVADDDPVIRHLVTSIVKKEGYTVVVATDGREAYRILQSDAGFSAAIFDMMMPHLEGIDIIRYMRTEKRLMRIPIMMISSDRNPRLMPDSFAAGATVFLSKPFTTEQFRATLGMLLSNSNGANERLHRVATEPDHMHKFKTRPRRNDV